MLFVVDFDGTVSRRDTVDALLEAHADPAWELLEARWLDGEISAVECMQGQLRLVRAERAELDRFFATIQLDPGFLPFYRHVSTFARLSIVSDGLDYAIKSALAHAGFPPVPVVANQLVFEPEGLSIAFPHRNPACTAGNGVCKCAVADRLRMNEREPVVLVGDGKSDACLAGEADLVFAKGWLIGHCSREGIPHIPFSCFDDVLRIVQAWPADEAGLMLPCEAPLSVSQS